jgi:rubrerythrin
MAKSDSIKKILQFAVSREIEAYRLYCSIAAIAKDPEVKTFITKLAKEELGHKSKLESEIQRIDETVDTEQELDEFEPADYIDQNIAVEFKDKHILEIAIGKEDISFKLYSNVLPKVRDKQLKRTLTNLAEDEARHKQRLEMKYNQILRNL